MQSIVINDAKMKCAPITNLLPNSCHHAWDTTILSKKTAGHLKEQWCQNWHRLLLLLLHHLSRPPGYCSLRKSYTVSSSLFPSQTPILGNHNDKRSNQKITIQNCNQITMQQCKDLLQEQWNEIAMQQCNNLQEWWRQCCSINQPMNEL